MTDLVSVASNAVQSYQRALGTVSNNIANVSTDGYSRQEVDFGPSQPNVINRHQPHQLIIRKGIIYVTIMLNVDYGHSIMLNINDCHCIRFANLLLDLIAVITSQINICYCK